MKPQNTVNSANVLSMAVIGVGAMGRGHCRTLLDAVPELRLAAVVDAHAETAQAVSAEFGVPAFTDLSQLLAQGGIDAVLVATPHPLHGPAVETCLSAGLHVLCEKPLAESVAAADRMLETARRTNCVLGVMFQRRFEPVFEAALRFAREGRLGDVRRTLLVLPDFRTQAYYDTNPWRATWKGEGGGVLINQAPHLLDLFALLGGMPNAVLGSTTTRLHAIEVEDQAEALLYYPNGATGFLHASTNAPKHHEMLEIVGTCGSLTYRNGQLECLEYPDIDRLARQSQQIWDEPKIVPYAPTIEPCQQRLQARVMSNFARHILMGEPLRCDAETSIQSLEIANAVILSGQRRNAVSVPVPRAEYEAHLEQLRATSIPRKTKRSVQRVTDPRLQ